MVMKWVQNVVNTKEMRNSYKSLSRSLKEGDHSVNQRIDVRIVLKRSLEKLGWVVWTGFI
jgi:hypothetical protein